MQPLGLDCLRASTCYEPETDGARPFRWTRPSFAIDLPDGDGRFVTLTFACLVPDTVLRWRQQDRAGEAVLMEGWQRLDFEVDPNGALECELDREFNPQGDTRALGIMIRAVDLHDDVALHGVINARQANAVANHAEYLAGSETLESVPPFLRVTMETACNIANEKACVYCSWDWAKREERHGATFTPALGARIGRYLAHAEQVTDCSYGEPPLARAFETQIAQLTASGRHVEFTSNGQTLSRKVRRSLLGRNIRVHVSVDASTAEGYRRYRDHRFDLVIENLRALCAEKRDHHDLPEVRVAFLVMRSNIDETPDFLELMKDVGVDEVVFRTLYLEDKLDERVVVHNGYRFDYDGECLSSSELDRLADRLRAEAETGGVRVTIEWDAFVANTSRPEAGLPLCSEPWKSTYLLNRGFLPCCYGRKPIVPWPDTDEADLEAGVAAALNSEPFRALRRDLAHGRLGDYCRDAIGCPIVKSLRK